MDVATRKGTTRLGSYEIVRKLARGGMAELFLAKSVGPQGFEKLVVLKKILPQYAASKKFVQLFLDEARLAAGFQHPNIAHVFDMGTVDGNYFFAMEFVHGQDVRSTLHRGWEKKRLVPIDLCVQIARAVASALHYAHEQRKPDGSLLDVVHRDVSPSNVMLSYDGTVKLLDFGVAKAKDSSSKTRTGTLKGKVSYMSPEQAKGSPIDRRSDIFSLGIVMWELITGTRLFRGENDLATIQMIINTTPAPPSQHRPECPPELEKIVQRALASEPDKRISTAQQLQVELEELAREHKLNQSPVLLGGYLNELFGKEIGEWKAAQSAGVSLGEYIGEHHPGDSLTTPVSDADISLFAAEVEEPDDDEIIDDDDDDEETNGDRGDDRPAARAGLIASGDDDEEDATESADIAMIDGVPQIVATHSLKKAPPPPAAAATAVGRRPTSSPVPIVKQPRSGTGPVAVGADATGRTVQAEVPPPPVIPPTPDPVVNDGDRTVQGQPPVRVLGSFPNIPNLANLDPPDPDGESVTIQDDRSRLPPELMTGPLPRPSVPRLDTTPVPTSFPVVTREQWTRQLNIPQDPPPPDMEVLLQQKRLKTTLIVVACVVVVGLISLIATSGSKPATPTPDPTPSPSDQIRYETDAGVATPTPTPPSTPSSGSDTAAGSGSAASGSAGSAVDTAGSGSGSAGSATAPTKQGSGSIGVGSGSGKKKPFTPPKRPTNPKFNLNSPLPPK